MQLTTLFESFISTSGSLCFYEKHSFSAFWWWVARHVAACGVRVGTHHEWAGGVRMIVPLPLHLHAIRQAVTWAGLSGHNFTAEETELIEHNSCEANRKTNVCVCDPLLLFGVTIGAPFIRSLTYCILSLLIESAKTCATNLLRLFWGIVTDNSCIHDFIKCFMIKPSHPELKPPKLPPPFS